MGEKIEAVALGVGTLLTVPLMILNWTSAVVGGMWLAFNHEWSLLIGGLLAILIGDKVLAVCMLPGIGLVALGVKAKRAIFHYPFFALAFLCNFIVIAFWCVASFSLAIKHTPANVWPYLLWGYAMATVPWVSMAKQEKNEGTIMWVSATQFGALAIMASILVGDGYQSDFGMRLFFVPAALLGMGFSYLMHRAARA